MNFYPYVKITQLTIKEIEKYMFKSRKNEKMLKLIKERSKPTREIKLEPLEDTDLKDDRAEIHTPSQIKDEVENTDDLVEVKTEQEDQIIPNTEGNQTFSNYIENVNGNEFICKICNVTCDNFEETLVHELLIHKSKPYVCRVCNAKFVLSMHLNVHLAEHENYRCMRNSSINPSEIQSSSKSSLTINPSKNYKNSKSTLELAKKSCNTNTSVNLKKNVSNKLIQNFCVTDPNITLQKTKLKPLKCVNCVFSTGSEVKFHNHLDICNNISKSIPKFQCNLCNKSFNSKYGLYGHLKCHTFRGEMISKNELRLEKIKIKNQLRNSGIVNSQRYVSPNIPNLNRNHKCKDCNIYFTTLAKLNIHQKQHKHPIKCNKCPKQFLLKKNLEKHLLSHKKVTMYNGESVSRTKIIKPTVVKKCKNQKILPIKQIFHCLYCNKYCKSKQSLGQHNRHHHSRTKLIHQKLNSKNSNIVECKWCSKSITKCNLLRHIKNLHPNTNPIKCKYCKMAFKDRVSLISHKYKFH